MKKKVLFSNKNEYLEIISCKDFNIEVKYILWWSDKELMDFSISACKEIKYFLKYNPLINFQEARKILYRGEISNNIDPLMLYTSDISGSSK